MTYFRWLGAKIGKKVCLYPNGGDPMMTEPDLVTLGNCVVSNRASSNTTAKRWQLP